MTIKGFQLLQQKRHKFVQEFGFEQKWSKANSPKKYSPKKTILNITNVLCLILEFLIFERLPIWLEKAYCLPDLA